MMHSSERMVSLASSGDKFCIAIISFASADGTKKKPCVIFKGKGEVKVNQILKDRRDVMVGWINNGWAKNLVIVDWLNANYSNTCFPLRLLVWDSLSATFWTRREGFEDQVRGRGCHS